MVREFINTTAIQEAEKETDEAIIDALQQTLVGRQLIEVNPNIKGFGIFNVDSYQIGAMGSAKAHVGLPSGQTKDMVTVTKLNNNLWSISKDFEIKKEDFWAFQRKGIKLDTTAGVYAAQACGELEDTMIIYGLSLDGTNYDINGMYLAAHTEDSTNYTLSTFGQATTFVAKAIGEIENHNAKCPAYNMVMNPADFAVLNGVRNATTGHKELPDILEMLNNGNTNSQLGGIVRTQAMPTGKAVIVGVDTARNHMELYNPVDLHSTIAESDPSHPETSGFTGEVYEIVLPHFKHTEHMVRLTDII